MLHSLTELMNIILQLNSKDAATIVLNAMSECALFGTHGNASGLRVGIVGAAARIIS